MVHVKIAQTYDLCTARNKIGLIGIHTPPRALLENHYGGLMNNHKFVKLKGCDVYFACASTLPVDPNGVGTGGGQVDPSDIMNPVLYKAVSNDSFETIISRIYGGAEISPSSDGSMLTYVEGLTPASNPPVGMDDFLIYYGILANSDDWRKAMPQVGFEMHGLVPYMYTMMYNMGSNRAFYGSTGDVVSYPVIYPEGSTSSGAAGGGASGTTYATGAVYKMRSHGVPSPPIPLWQGLDATVNPTVPIPVRFPKTYVGAVIVPPCHTSGSRIYYRLRVVWHVEFLGLTSHQNFSSFLEMNNNGAVSYYNGYTTVSKSMEAESDTVDANGFELEKIMEGGS